MSGSSTTRAAGSRLLGALSLLRASTDGDTDESPQSQSLLLNLPPEILNMIVQTVAAVSNGLLSSIVNLLITARTT